MSWLMIVNEPVDTNDPNWPEVVEAVEVSLGEETVKTEQEVAIAWAKDVIIDTISGNIIGSKGKSFRVSASGHCNPNNEPREGWSNDMITISIGQV